MQRILVTISGKLEFFDELPVWNPFEEPDPFDGLFLFPEDIEISRLHGITAEEVILLYVVDEGTMELLFDGYSMFYEDERTEIEDIKRKLEDEAIKMLQPTAETVRKSLKAKKVKLMVRFGHPCRETAKVAMEEGVSLVVSPCNRRKHLGSALANLVKLPLYKRRENKLPAGSKNVKITPRTSSP
jgi:nucleotide-binding universal stress UspA family protein